MITLMKNRLFRKKGYPNTWSNALAALFLIVSLVLSHAAQSLNPDPGGSSPPDPGGNPPLLDFGDAHRDYPVLLADDGARHRVSPLRLGVDIDYESNGQPSVAADRDGSDEDGILFTSSIERGGSATFEVTVSGGPGRVTAWVDWNRDFDWNDPNEMILSNVYVLPGTSKFTVSVPGTASVGHTFSRFRLSTLGTGVPTGSQPDGEVEDYLVEVTAPMPPDLEVTLDPVPLELVESAIAELGVTVANNGSGIAEDVVVSMATPNLAISGLVATPSQGSCILTEGALSCDLGDVDPMGMVTIDLSFIADEEGDLSIEVIADSPTVDLNPGNDVGVVVLPVRRRDYGDAPNSYLTYRGINGPSHRVRPGWRLGASVDRDPNGMPSGDADGDDVLDGNDDEDGVTFLTPIVPGMLATVEVDVTVPTNGFLHAWYDVHRDGSFIEPEDHIIVDELVTTGVQTFSFLVPSNAVPGFSYVRFRLSPYTGISYEGPGGAGEVEDYGQECRSFDFGDAPDSYHTTMGVDGARHLVGGQLYIGDYADEEDDGNPSPDAQGDDLHSLVGTDDETGLVSIVDLMPGALATVEVFMTVPPGTVAYLDAWVDFNTNGVFDHSTELFIPSAIANNGVNTLHYAVPHDAVPGETYIRFRLSEAGSLLPEGLALTGEVEDYRITIDEPGSVVVDGLEASPSGGAVVTTDGAQLTISNIGSSGEDGVAIALDEVEMLDTVFTEPFGFGMPGSLVEAKMVGDQDQLLATVSIHCGTNICPDGIAQLRSDIPGAANSFVDFDDITVLLEGGQLDALVSATGGNPVQIRYIGAVQSDELRMVVLFEYPVAVTLDGLNSSTTRSIVLRATKSPQIFRMFELAARGQSEINAWVGRKFYDYGDAPDPDYATEASSDGARHFTGLGLGYYLGPNIDWELSAQSSDDADGDDNHASDDEDGVVMDRHLLENTTATVEVEASLDGRLDAWIDYDSDGVWEDDEKIFDAEPLTAGGNTLTFDVGSTRFGTFTFARFRFSSNGGLDPTGFAVSTLR